MSHKAIPEVTIKFRAPEETEHAIYFTIAGAPTPYIFFVNSKEMKSFQWITALMTAWSREVRDGVPIERIIQDTKETFDGKGGYLIPDGSGDRVHSVVHHMGLLLEKVVIGGQLNHG